MEKHTIEITCSAEAAEYLTDLLSYLRHCGGIGHSVSIVADDQHFYFDGDGASRIDEIKVDGAAVDQSVIKGKSWEETWTL